MPALFFGWALAVALCFSTSAARADETQLAVAANFAGAAQRIATEFAAATGHRALVSTGATGAFFAQIEAGAPFDVLLAADQATPARLEADGFAVPGTRSPYAVGRLVLWSKRPGLVDEAGAVLRRATFAHLAIANPKLAPYGAAAMQVLERLGLVDAIRPKLVVGESIAQAYQFVATGNAELGFVALSQVSAPGAGAGGSSWIVPADLYSPIVQDVVLLKRGTNNRAARAFLEFLRSRRAKEIIASFGYGASP